MKTYPHQEGDGIIELVRKDEHDAVVRELQKLLADANRGAERNAHINRSFAGQINQLHSDIQELNATKDEHDKALELLREIRDDQVNAQDEADKFLRDHQPSELSKLRVELTRWQSLAESLATVLTRCDNLLSGEMTFRRHSPIWQVLNGIEIYDSIKPALAAYKSGNLPDPLAEAVKRMEAVPCEELNKAYWNSGQVANSEWGCDRVRTRLISAAKGEQP